MDGSIVLRPFTPEEYHAFFRRYVPDPVTDAAPFTYNREQIDRSYRYNYGGFQENYAHFGIFLDDSPVGSLQLKRMDFEKGTVEVGQREKPRNRHGSRPAGHPCRPGSLPAGQDAG